MAKRRNRDWTIGSASILLLTAVWAQAQTGGGTAGSLAGPSGGANVGNSNNANTGILGGTAGGQSQFGTSGINTFGNSAPSASSTFNGSFGGTSGNNSTIGVGGLGSGQFNISPNSIGPTLGNCAPDPITGSTTNCGTNGGSNFGSSQTFGSGSLRRTQEAGQAGVGSSTDTMNLPSGGTSGSFGNSAGSSTSGTLEPLDTSDISTNRD